jgi:hypothetical protein
MAVTKDPVKETIKAAAELRPGMMMAILSSRKTCYYDVFGRHDSTAYYVTGVGEGRCLEFDAFTDAHNFLLSIGFGRILAGKEENTWMDLVWHFGLGHEIFGDLVMIYAPTKDEPANLDKADTKAQLEKALTNYDTYSQRRAKIKQLRCFWACGWNFVVAMAVLHLLLFIWRCIFSP